jgi:serine/threonine-protein kinase
LDAFGAAAIIPFEMAGDPHIWQPDDVIAAKYRLVRVLGEGGMGVVYEAYHLRLRQRVAIKMLRPALATRYNVVVRFEREARAAAQLHSSHVAKVIDVDATPDGVPYIVMEFLEGRNFSQVIAEKRGMAIHDVVGWVLETCCAIAEAHDLGIIHRDLKPSNLLLAKQGDRSIVKVLDFGISKLADENDISLTTTQGTLGTPNYMSPEQVRSAKHVDGRTDIWSIGVILYELLTGTLPFRGATSTAVGAAIVADPVPNMRELRPDLPPELEAVVQKALSKRVEDRFADIRALTGALAPFAKLDAYAAAEVSQMLAVASRRSSPSSEIGVAAAATSAPTVPGWSQITASPAGPQRRTLLVGALATLVAVGWLASGLLRRTPALETSAPSGQPAAPATAPVAVSAAAAEPQVDLSAPRPIPSSPEATSRAAPDASPPGSAPQPAPKTTHPKPKPTATSTGAPNATPPAPSNNPLHL